MRSPDLQFEKMKWKTHRRAAAAAACHRPRTPNTVRAKKSCSRSLSRVNSIICAAVIQFPKKWNDRHKEDGGGGGMPSVPHAQHGASQKRGACPALKWGLLTRPLKVLCSYN